MKRSPVASLSRSRSRFGIATLLLVFTFVIAIYYAAAPSQAKVAVTPSVAVNKYFNSGTTADVLELLVIQDALDMRGMIVKDFSSNMANDGGGKYQFSTDSLWSSVRSGTLIVLRNDNSAADTSVGGADYNLDIGLQNTTYFSNQGGTFDIATTDMVMIKSAGSGSAGVTGSIHVLAGGTAGAQFTAAPSPKLRATGTSAGGQFVFANNSTQSGADFDGTDATGAATGLTFGAGNNANNTAYINSLRNPGAITLSINNVTVSEGNSGTTTATFTVSLSGAAGAGGVTFDIATQDDTATVADGDYVGRSLVSQTISQGNQSFSFAVTVNGDTNTEGNETFFVNVTNVSGAIIADGQGVGTITNDDFASVPIHTIQGSGTMSPFANQVVTTVGIVTGVKSNGFFIQTPDAEADADPNTSEGVFVFTSSAPPAAAAIGNSVAVMGTVQEFIPSADLNSPPTTEFSGSLMVSLLSTGNALPAPVTLTAANTSPAGSIEQLERFEGMRVHVNSLTVVAPTQGTVNETSATATTNGVFYGVITGIARPFREPGIETPDPAPAGSPCCIPRFDANPERLRIDSDAQPGTTPLEVTTGATVTNITGPLDYGFRTYTIVPDAATTPVVTGNVSGTPVPVPSANEFTVASFNMERFFDTTDDPGISDSVLTAAAFNNRLNKASLAIRNMMRYPDILGVEEMENLTTLQAVANKLNSDAVAAGDPNPNYQGFLVEGNDVGGIDSGFLVKTSRVNVIDVTQFGKTTTYINPNNGQPELLNDRPPLVLRATVIAPDTSTFAITVIVNHLRSLTGVDDPADGNRIRTKRRAQAEYLANLIQARQVADPTERIISVGDYNAFQFNDGYTDSIGTIKGTPTPSNEVVLASSDLVNPDLTDLLDFVPADQRYSFSFDGNAQVLDHELISSNLLPLFNRIAYARNNGDFPETFRNDPNRPERLSDHDMAVAYFNFVAAPCSFSLSSTSQAFSGAGGDGNVSVITHSGCSWTAASNDNWIIITSDSGGSGNGTISFTIRENLTTQARTGTMSVAGLTFTITQAGGAGDCTYSISPASRTFGTSGGTGTVNVSVTGGCGWTATSNVAWISITSGGSGVGSGTVDYSVAANAGPARSGSITIAGQVFTVKQKGN